MSAPQSTIEERIDGFDSRLDQIMSTIEKGFAGTKADTDDVLNVLDTMMTRIDERFTKSEDAITQLQKSVHSIQNQLDSIEKRLEISEDERLVMAHQLTQLHEWVEEAAKRIGVKFAR